MALKSNSELWNYFDNLVEEGMAECKTCKQRLRNNRSFNLRQHIRKVHNVRNEIWKYFDNFVLEGMAVCRTCKQRLKNRTCNLRLHMRRTHNIEVKPPEDDVVERPSSPQPYDPEQINAVLEAAKRKMNEEPRASEIRSKRRLYIKMEKRTIIRAIIGLVVEDGMTPSLFASPHMEALLQPMCEAISDQEGREFKVNETEIEGMLSLVANYVRNDFSNDLHWRLLSLKIDTDINGPPGTFCVSAVFVNEGQVQTRVLAVIDLEADIQLNDDHIKQVLHKFNIDSNQIVSACWDNSKSKYNQQVTNSEYMSHIQKFETYPDIYLGEVKVERYIGTIAQLCLLDLFKNCSILQPFLECRNLVKFVSDESNGYHETFEQKNLSMPQLDSPWKWGSTYKMMHDLNEARSILEHIKYEQLDNPEDQFNLNHNLWSFIDAFCKGLNILQKSILKYYNEEMHFGDFYAQWLKCKLLTEKLSATNKLNKQLVLIVTELQKCMAQRSAELLAQHRFEACLFLDPRFQRTLSLHQKSNAIEYLKKLWNRSKLYNVDNEDNDSASMEASAATKTFEDEEDAFLNEFLCQDAQIKDTRTTEVYKSIEDLKLTFQTVDSNILLFWADQKLCEPEIHTLSNICFAMPATQCFFKTLYSHVYQLENNSKLSDFSKENLLIIRLNAHLLDDALEQSHLLKDDKSNTSLQSDGDNDTNMASEEDSNAVTASTSPQFGIVLASKTAIVHPMSSVTHTPTANIPSGLIIKAVTRGKKTGIVKKTAC